MKKYSILLAILALVFASLACKTVTGGNNGVPNIVPPGDNGGMPTVPPVATDDNGNTTIGGESPFPTTSDAFNIVNTPTSVTYQTKLSADDVMKFYRDELGKQGFTEDTSMTTSFNGIIAMFFKGNGKSVVVGGAPAGDGSMSVTVAYQQ